ncbi:MAG TPA: hypothetical protein PLP29_11735, partial [Candidatus Ozemobacteraceae bacterium]|nr:hypothetical protein [Candidatus Ozemobacteraceae bacterium]
MKSGFLNKILALVLMFGLFTAAEVSAGKPGHCHKKKKVGFFQKIGRAFVKVGDKIKNKIMDTHVNVKKAVTGRKNRVWVCGHYNKNGKHVKGHWRYVKGHCGNHPGQGNNPGQGNSRGQGGIAAWVPYLPSCE